MSFEYWLLEKKISLFVRMQLTPSLIKYCALKTCEDVYVQLHTFLNFTLDQVSSQFHVLGALSSSDVKRLLIREKPKALQMWAL